MFAIAEGKPMSVDVGAITPMGGTNEDLWLVARSRVDPIVFFPDHGAHSQQIRFDLAVSGSPVIFGQASERTLFMGTCSVMMSHPMSPVVTLSTQKA